MKLTSPNNIKFKSLYNNKIVLNALEKISDHSASFQASASMLGAIALRPLAISLIPGVDKDNKKYLSANSLSSALGKFLIAETLILPVESMIKKTNQKEIKNYNIKAQIIKQAAGILSAIPKSLVTIALIPFLVDKLFPHKKNPDFNFQLSKEEKNRYKNVISFKGNPINSILNSKKLDKFIDKTNINEKNLARNASVITDVLLVGSSSFFTKKSKKIKEDKKNPLIYNNIISTLLCILGGCGIDKLIQGGTKNSINEFKKIHKNDPKLNKYIEGINVVRPALIFACIYYGILPIFSGFIADKIDRIQKAQKK